MNRYDYFKSGSVWKILQFAIIIELFFKKKKKVRLSQKINSYFHNKWVHPVTWLARFKLVAVHAWRGTVKRVAM